MNNTLILRGGESLARDTRTVFELLEKLQGGLLEVRLPDGSCALFGDGEQGVTLQVHDEAMFGRVLARGDIGLGLGQDVAQIAQELGEDGQGSRGQGDGHEKAFRDGIRRECACAAHKLLNRLDSGFEA